MPVQVPYSGDDEFPLRRTNASDNDGVFEADRPAEGSELVRNLEGQLPTTAVSAELKCLQTN